MCKYFSNEMYELPSQVNIFGESFSENEGAALTAVEQGQVRYSSQKLSSFAQQHHICHVQLIILYPCHPIHIAWLNIC